MAFYTITLQEICEGISGQLKTYDEIIEKALPKIFSFNFPCLLYTSPSPRDRG